MSFLLRTSLAALVAVGVASPVLAQPTPKAEDLTPSEKNNLLRDQEVTKRDQPDYAAKGVDLGGFKFLPTLEATERFTSNLYYEQNNHRKELVTTVTPGLRLKSDWNVHELEFYANSEIKRHRRFWGEDVENYTAGANGKLDVTSELLLRGRVNWNAGHEARSSPDDVGGITPTKTQTQGAMLGAEYHGPRIRLRTEAEVTEYQFWDVRKADGTMANNTGRNRRVGELRQRVGYEIIPEYTAFAEVIYNDRRYDTADANGTHRDSHGWENRVGTEIEISGALRGEVFASYLMQYYNDPIYRDVEGPGAGASLTWTPTGLTTVKGGIKRTINETTSRYSAGNLATRYDVSVAHELQRNIILEADGALTQTAYMRLGRHDKLWSGGMTGTYKINRYLYTALDYHAARQDNNLSTGQYLEHSTFLKLGVQY
ncbi:outer membrane beta-barrel protein [Paramagnetospirillum magneticum]|uniref:Outer membrane beta-barrel protein n=1 Tax=Paramagnetospirillum magneticum (strain ATCC 700264 / AMB-1) TaxID=342108 RepID=Q2W7C3_PARM1|nr:outer membrane beta-barrel protein [Paramagnetospirillum magneticum]BAE50252.1 Uncharacterized protein amb1448 [Paramagnetospirillum magneticum AMB-1]